jgi:hypothetical protein
MAYQDVLGQNQFETNFMPFESNRIIYFTDPIPPDFYPNSYFLMRQILWRQHQNMNSFILIVGSVRSGKSYFGLKFSEDYCNISNIQYDVNKQCSFDIKPFLYWSKDAHDNIFMLDEIQASLSPQDWYSVLARVFNVFCQCQGFRRNVLIMTLPNVAFLLKSIRFMCNYIIETMSQGNVSIRKLSMNHALGKGYLEFIGTIHFRKPSYNTLQDYENMKKDWNDKRLVSDINYIEMLERPSDYEIKRQKYFDLRMKNMELQVKLKENKLKTNKEYGY